MPRPDPDILEAFFSPKRQCGPVATMYILSLRPCCGVWVVWVLVLFPPFRPLVLLTLIVPFPCPATPTPKQQEQPQGKYEGKKKLAFSCPGIQ